MRIRIYSPAIDRPGCLDKPKIRGKQIKTHLAARQEVEVGGGYIGTGSFVLNNKYDSSSWFKSCTLTEHVFTGKP